MNYTCIFAFCNILVPDCILAPINTMHQNTGAQNETCHHSTVFTGKKDAMGNVSCETPTVHQAAAKH